MASFGERQAQIAAKRLKHDEFSHALNVLTKAKVEDLRGIDVKDLQAVLVLKFGLAEFLCIREFVAGIPAAAENYMKPVIKTLLKNLTLTEYSDNESACITKLIRETVGEVERERLAKAFIEAGSVNKQPALIVIKPPVENCLQCKNKLSLNNKGSHVTIFSLSGIKPGLKFTLKCQHCKLFYGYAKYGNYSTGYRLYEVGRDMIECSNETYMERQIGKFQVNLA